MKKQIPNLISITRIIGSMVLWNLDFTSKQFLVVYLLCGLSDVLDGYIARKYLFCSNFGARLDSMADLCFNLVLAREILILVPGSVIIIISILFIKGLTLLIGYLHFSSLVMLHTLTNKLTGLFLLCR